MSGLFEGTDAPEATFGPTFVIESTSQHKYTAILLHGRGSTGAEFAEQLSDSDLATEQAECTSPAIDHFHLACRLPRWRWVFPTAKTAWSTLFEEEVSTWFDEGASDNDTTRQSVLAQNLTHAISHVRAILDDEVARLGDSRRVVLGGISQGGATAMWTLLACHAGAVSRNGREKIQSAQSLGGFIGLSMWLPFVSEVEEIISRSILKDAGSQCEERNESVQQAEPSKFRPRLQFVASALRALTIPSPIGSIEARTPLISPTPVFLGHGSDDAYVDVELGRQASRVVSQLGFGVEWKEYVGAEQEGHWIKVPEEVDDIVDFINIRVEAGDGIEG